MKITWNGSTTKHSHPNGLRKELCVHIGKQLFALRQEKQVSMRVVANGAGLSNPIICQIENGQTNPSAETLWKLSVYFEVDPAYWFDGFRGVDE